jgi:hypothetical protein
VGWLFGSLVRLVVDGIVVVPVSCLSRLLKVMSGVRLFCVFVLAGRDKLTCVLFSFGGQLDRG